MSRYSVRKLRHARNLPSGCGSLARKGISWNGRGHACGLITSPKARQARQKLADSEQKNECASAALIEARIPARSIMPHGNRQLRPCFGELFKMMAGVDLVVVHYRSSFFPDLLGGQIQVTISPIPSSIDFTLVAAFGSADSGIRIGLDHFPPAPICDLAKFTRLVLDCLSIRGNTHFAGALTAGFFVYLKPGAGGRSAENQRHLARSPGQHPPGRQPPASDDFGPRPY